MKVRLATLTQTVRGKFTVWKKGQVVKAHYTGIKGARYAIERVKWRKPLVELANSCINVPRSALEFHERI